MNCWEFMGCDPDTFKRCPAFPHKGLECWLVTGTWCSQGLLKKASVTEKLEFCRSCAYFKEHAGKL